jgi:hypothetical protein
MGYFKMTVAELKEIISKLEDNLVTATNKATALQVERRKIAFSACNGDAHARSVLDELNTDSTVASLEIENAKAAVDEARWKLFEAERKEERAAQRAKAEKVRAVTKEMEFYGPAISTAAADLCRHLAGFNDALENLRRWDVPVANGRLVALAFTRTLFAKLREVGILVDIVPPGLRSEPEYLVKAYLEAPKKWVANTLGEPSETRTAAADVKDAAQVAPHRKAKVA